MTAATLGPWLVAATVAAPLLLSLPAARRPSGGRWLLVAAALPALLTAALPAGSATLELPWLLLGAQLALDGPGRLLLMASAAVWLAAALYAAAADGLRGAGARAGFGLAMAGNFGVVLAHDPASFFACYALMSFAAYLLVVETGDAAARRAGRVYITLVVIGEVVVLSGLLAAVQGSEPQAASAARWLLWIGFGIKAGLLPLHFSLPITYGAASTAGATALAGAMVNAGLLGWLRFLAPEGEPPAGLGAAVVALGLAGAFYGVAVGVTQRDPKVLLGYSSVSQMGLMAVGVGTGLMVPAAWPVVAAVVSLYAAHHAFAKATLFVGLGVTTHTGSRAAWLALWLPAAALVGLPLTSGAVAKTALKATVPVLPAPWPDILAVALPVATVGTTLLMARLLFLASPPIARAMPSGARWTAYAPLLAAVALGPWWLGADLSAAAAAWSGALWPGLAGGALAAALLLAYRRGLVRAVPALPPGDVLLPIESVASRVWRHVSAAPAPHHADGEHAAQVPAPHPLAGTLARGERRLSRWESAGLAVLALALAVAAATALGGG